MRMTLHVASKRAREVDARREAAGGGKRRPGRRARRLARCRQPRPSAQARTPARAQRRLVAHSSRRQTRRRAPEASQAERACACAGGRGGGASRRGVAHTQWGLRGAAAPACRFAHAGEEKDGHHSLCSKKTKRANGGKERAIKRKERKTHATSDRAGSASVSSNCAGNAAEGATGGGGH